MPIDTKRHVWTSGNRGNRWARRSAALRALQPGGFHHRRLCDDHYVGLDVSQKLTAICVVDDSGRRLWRGQCPSDPEQIERNVRRHGGDDARIGIETGPMTPWLVHELRGPGVAVTCFDARYARAVLKMQISKTDQNDDEGLAHIMRTGWGSCPEQGTRPMGIDYRVGACKVSSSAYNAIVEPYPRCAQDVRHVTRSEASPAVRPARQHPARRPR